MSTTQDTYNFLQKVKDGDHLVQFYQTDEFLVDSIINFIAPALMQGEAAVVVATDNHIYRIEENLKELEVDTRSLQKKGQLQFLDAELILKNIMTNGLPDPVKFYDVLDGIFAGMMKKFPGIKAYGELVSLLWDEDNSHEAIELEKIWSDYLTSKKIVLMCGYSMEGVCAKDSGKSFNDICAHHGHVMPPEIDVEFCHSSLDFKTIAESQHNSLLKDKKILDIKLDSLELLLPLTALNIQLQDMKKSYPANQLLLDQMVSRCEIQLTRMRGIIEKLTK